jgi:hypothetical protein
MLLRAAVIGEMAVARAVEAVEQCFLAARAVQDVTPGLALIVVVLVQQAEELEDAGWRQLSAFEIVEPDALAGKADIKGDFAVQLALEAVSLHWRATGRAGRTQCGYRLVSAIFRFHWKIPRRSVSEFK